jgi:hypothetical protein
LKSLKQLQDVLGEFNDLSVQQEHLCEFALRLTTMDEKNTLTILALGMLIGRLNERQREVKKQFSVEFKKFADISTQKIVNDLFQHSERNKQ